MLKKSAILLVVVLVAGVYFLPEIKDRIASSGRNEATETVAPAFSVQGLKGETIRLSDLRGKVVLVNFWATWCPYCVTEIPDLEKVYRANKDRGFTILGISTDAIPDSFIRQMGITYPLAMGKQDVVSDYRVSGIPVSFLIDGDGRVVKRVMGVYSEGALQSDLERVLKKS